MGLSYMGLNFFKEIAKMSLQQKQQQKQQRQQHQNLFCQFIQHNIPLPGDVKGLNIQ